MRLVVTAVLPLFLMVGCGDHGLDTPRAAADTSATTPTEIPPTASSVVFEDDARILDSRPMTFDTWSRSADDSAVIVHFTSGTPQCHGVHATVRETADAVEIALRGGTPPEAVGKACILIAVQGSLTVPLATPLADRSVLSAS
ncbi:hypothetical protein MSTE_04824 [Mycobacteroides stephanolepidis]|uniref:Lipoprotein n=1 Tax=[Mycobacterium] stephanolepidis TaxID=1520670 RepID=A0A1Z4F4E1_9MYCO|nr:hypothetical protein [[Mycobacterium] stephanolepidis]BAY00116.1 hypothetical protein MSTE_04824 [[Mycobacterium] stephanolepidis]